MDSATASALPAVAVCPSCVRFNELANSFERLQGEVVALRRVTDQTRTMTSDLQASMDRLAASTAETARVTKETQTTVARLCARTVTP